jgi:hypothetical protein
MARGVAGAKGFARRDPKRLRELAALKIPAPHPLFKIVPGEVREREKVK